MKMKKLYILVITLFAISLFSCSTDNTTEENMGITESTADGYFDGVLYYQIVSNSSTTLEVTVSKTNKTAKIIEIPSQVKIMGKSYMVSYISPSAFGNNEYLQMITIPLSIKEIGEKAFWGCKSLYHVINKSNIPQSEDTEIFEYYGNLHIPKNKKETYANCKYWKEFNILEDAEEKIENTEVALHKRQAFVDNALMATWAGNTNMAIEWNQNVYMAYESEITFSPGNNTQGTGYWIDKFSDCAWDYVANHIKWEIKNGIIFIHFQEDNHEIQLKDYSLSTTNFRGRIEIDGGQPQPFELRKMNGGDRDWNSYNYGWGYWNN